MMPTRRMSCACTLARLSPAALRRMLCVAVLTLAPLSATPAADLSIGVQAPPGFEVTLYADDELAHDIFAMTVDSQGRVVVSGAGYVRILIDSDGDGRADTFRQFVDGPKTGAQGLYFHGRDLLCTGDAGLIRYRDENGDDVADGPPDLFLQVKAGGEHDSHAIRRGPDGWWYVICGNMAGIDKNYITLPESPVRNPERGTLLRLSPDLTRGEVVAHGYRNAYDFDFDAQTDIYTFDSDGEREISLPWYVPTRVLQAAPGSHAGWLSRNWKRPNGFFDMPPVTGDFGRGSPTGVVCYRHTQFPEEYQGALFALDWTYGRVFAVRLNRNGSAAVGEATTFLTAIGEHGFAPTDAEVGPDGSLYVSVGGRGTRGGVYRIRAKDRAPRTDGREIASLEGRQKLIACLSAPQPLSSWSRRQWEPAAQQLGAEAFRDAVLDPALDPQLRARALEILTEKFGGLDAAAARALATVDSVDLRARAAWSLGRSMPRQDPARLLEPFVSDETAFVQRHALEALLTAPPEIADRLAEPIGNCLDSPDQHVRMAAVRILAKMNQQGYLDASAAGAATGWRAGIAIAAAYAERNPGVQPYVIDVSRRVLAGRHPRELKIDAARLMQIGLGDLAPPEGKIAGVFEGYASRESLEGHAEATQPALAAVAKLFPTGDVELDRELGRILAMLAPADPALLSAVLSQITEGSDPVEDLHWLIISARLPAARSSDAQAAIARAIVGLDQKIRARGLPLDSNWDDRIGEMYMAHVDADSKLPEALLDQPQFGRPAHVAFVMALPPERFHDAVDAFLRQIKADPEYAWNSDVIFLLSHSLEPEPQELVLSKFEDIALRNAVLTALASDPQSEHRALFVEGLENSPLDVLAECVKALLLLEPGDSPQEQVALVRILRRLGSRGQEREARDQAIEVLQRNTGLRFAYSLGRDGDDQQAGIQQWTDAIRERYPEEFERQTAASGVDVAQLFALLDEADWSQGDEQRGRRLFESRACVQCHGSSRALGPDLNGVARRFSREDLFVAIADPSRDVSPRYQTTMIATVDGEVYAGLIVYESVDGLVLRNSTNQTFRIESRNIETRRTLNESLMPNGLLKDLGPQDLADLYAYLRSLGTGTTLAGDGVAEGL
ncbi:MAG: c-type cytochrome [Planctomyces sp.]|nr:c-type cytochrome [Planctomyces sp.]